MLTENLANEESADTSRWINGVNLNSNRQTAPDKNYANDKFNLYPVVINIQTERSHTYYDNQDEVPDNNRDYNADRIDRNKNIISRKMDNNIDSNESTLTTTYFGSGFGVFHQHNSIADHLYNGLRGERGAAATAAGANDVVSGGGGRVTLLNGFVGGNNGVGFGGSGHSTYSSPYGYGGVHTNVNFLLGGAMLTLIMTILCVVCYCCHRNIRKRTEAAYRQQRQWLENDPNMEIYSVEQYYESSGLFLGESTDGFTTVPTLHHEPPPSYNAVVAMQERQQLLVQQQQQQQRQQQHHSNYPHFHPHQNQQFLFLQRQNLHNSPPPGYRSSLDITTTASASLSLSQPLPTSASSSVLTAVVSANVHQHHHQQTSSGGILHPPSPIPVATSSAATVVPLAAGEIVTTVPANIITTGERTLSNIIKNEDSYCRSTSACSINSINPTVNNSSGDHRCHVYCQHHSPSLLHTKYTCPYLCQDTSKSSTLMTSATIGNNNDCEYHFKSKVLNGAQSCCSLQRAEVVENMWQQEMAFNDTANNNNNSNNKNNHRNATTIDTTLVATNYNSNNYYFNNINNNNNIKVNNNSNNPADNNLKGYRNGNGNLNKQNKNNNNSFINVNVNNSNKSSKFNNSTISRSNYNHYVSVNNNCGSTLKQSSSFTGSSTKDKGKLSIPRTKVLSDAKMAKISSTSLSDHEPRHCSLYANVNRAPKDVSCHLETFGNRYLNHGSYKRGCPLCGKFRNDNLSTLSLSTESDLDRLATTGLDDDETMSEITDDTKLQENYARNDNLLSMKLIDRLENNAEAPIQLKDEQETDANRSSSKGSSSTINNYCKKLSSKDAVEKMECVCQQLKTMPKQQQINDDNQEDKELNNDPLMTINLDGDKAHRQLEQETIKERKVDKSTATITLIAYRTTMLDSLNNNQIVEKRNLNNACETVDAAQDSEISIGSDLSNLLETSRRDCKQNQSIVPNESYCSSTTESAILQSQMQQHNNDNYNHNNDDANGNRIEEGDQQLHYLQHPQHPSQVACSSLDCTRRAPEALQQYDNANFI